jgi:uncharacterized protein (TIGR04551 family)
MRYLILASILSFSAVADAQMGPYGGGAGGMGPVGPQQPAGEEKKEGVAVEAPKTPELLPTTPALPPQKSRRKRWKLLEMDGYFRLRGDYFKNFNLGFLDEPALGGAPFPRDLACNSTSLNHPCDESVRGANMRLRLEPTINIDEGISVHVQADALDNLVLGSTPLNETLSGPSTTGPPPPVTGFGNTQGNVVRGVNSDRDSLVVKRAWAEVAIPLGVLKAGRMPNQWGMGIWANAGGYDPVTGLTNYDADYGDSVDRVSFTAQIPGTPLRAMIAADWDATGLTSNLVGATGNASTLGTTGQYAGYSGHPFDLDDSDDSNGWVGVISKMESPQDFREAVDRGESVLDYGVYFEYKTQDWAENTTGLAVGGTFDPTPATAIVPRNLKTYTPDVWLHWGYGPWDVEGEFVGTFGSLQDLTDFSIMGGANIRKMGGALRGSWRGYDNKLKLGIEAGFATGDQWDNVVQGQTNVAYENQVGLPTICNAQHSCTLTQFTFNRDYQVDLIMWRYLFGAVTNAVYYKPFVEYDFTKSITAKLWNVTSMAMKPVSTPGNSLFYGTEFDADVGYHDGRVYAGISYGILLPFGAMAHPDDAGVNFGAGNVGDPGTAQAVQARLVLAF